MNEFMVEFKRIVDRCPQNYAIVQDGDTKLTYSQLFIKAQKMASFLIVSWVRKWDVVAIQIEKSIEYIVSLLWIWLCWWAFMPFMSSLPQERRKFIINDSWLKFLLISKKYIKSDEKIDFDDKNIKVLIYEDIESANDIFDMVDVSDKDLAYLIYTSWTTWNPKWVLVNHTWIVNILKQQIKMIGLTPKSRSLFLLSINFDASLSDIGTALLSWACLYIETIDKEKLVMDLPNIINERKITYIDIPPSMLSVLDIDKIWDSLKILLIWWEICTVNTIRKWASRYKLINVYGPTEATICTSMIMCDPNIWNQPDIWDLIDGIEYVLIDDKWEIVVWDWVWELLIWWIWLARWYLNKKDLNESKFIYIGWKRLYRSWDFIERKNWRYIFRWRLDRQLKIRWQLVELEEVELVIRSYENIIWTAVLVDKKSETNKRLVAFIEGKVDIKNFQAYISKKLPNWMMPSKFIFVETLPKNVNWKIDYNQLKIMLEQKYTKNTELHNSYSMEDKILNLWKNIFDDENIWIHDDFYWLGWDSLSTLEMVVGLNKLGINVPVGVIAKQRTIQDICNRYKSNERQLSDMMNTKELQEDTKIWNDIEQLIYLSQSSDFDRYSKISIIDTDMLTQSDNWENSVYFITWWNWFLWVRVVKRLMELWGCRKFYILVRWKSNEQAKKRFLWGADMYWVDFSVQQLESMEFYCWDVSEPKFWFNDQDYISLSNKVTDIIHLATQVNMIKTYNWLKAWNVWGVKEVIKFALTNMKKTIHYASTLSVFVATDKNLWTVYEDDDLKGIWFVYGGYAQSKWVAERIFHDLPKWVLDVNIFRYGLLTGDSINWIYSDHDFLEMFIRWVISLWKVPKWDHDGIYLDVTPIDYAVEVTARLIDSWFGKCYHIANKWWFSFAQILRVLKQKWVEIEVVDPKLWYEWIKDKDVDHIESSAIMGLCRLLPFENAFDNFRTMDLFQWTDMVFDCRNVESDMDRLKPLYPSLLSIPKPDDILLWKYLDILIKRRYE